jgi:DNA-binding NarL/FixJ family response regulator
MIRVLIADDHAMMRDSVARLLERTDGCDCVAAARDGREAVELAERLAPDVVLMDIEMPELDGIAATSAITARLPESRVVMLTTFADRERVNDALDAGAIGYLLKDAEPADVARAVRAAAGGHSPIAPRAATALLAARSARQPAAELTAREREVLELVADGLPNKLIARRLGISQRTVKGHLTNIFQRIGVTDRTQAALWATRHRIHAS